MVDRILRTGVMSANCVNVDWTKSPCSEVGVSFGVKADIA